MFELGFAGQNTRQPIPRLGLLLLLKSFQKLGYFVRLAEIPLPIVRHIAQTLGWNQIPEGLSAYDASTARFRQMALVRSYVASGEQKTEALRKLASVRERLGKTELEVDAAERFLASAPDNLDAQLEGNIRLRHTFVKLKQPTKALSHHKTALSVLAKLRAQNAAKRFEKAEVELLLSMGQALRAAGKPRGRNKSTCEPNLMMPTLDYLPLLDIGLDLPNQSRGDLPTSPASRRVRS